MARHVTEGMLKAEILDIIHVVGKIPTPVGSYVASEPSSVNNIPVSRLLGKLKEKDIDIDGRRLLIVLSYMLTKQLLDIKIELSPDEKDIQALLIPGTNNL